jgi:DNA-directed RNA polymerase III subunit RPC6
LNADERLLYHHIDQAQAEGIWSKALRARTNMTPQALNKCLKSLETKELVQMVMSVKHPNRKMYLLKHLRPSEDMAGGPWQSEGEFDTALIETISRIVEKFVEEQTCISVPPGYNDYEAIETTPKKGQKRGVQDIEDAPAVKRARPSRAAPRQVLRQDPKYPTAASLLNDVLNLNVIKGPKNIRENDMEQLLEMMVLEGRLEKLTATNYRLAMKNKDADEGLNGFVDAPCGTCPVFDLCGDSGEISARTCVYYSEWLSTGLDIS